MCNGCRGGFNNSSRYLCLTCRPGVKQNDGFVDYCHECINQMCNNENSKKELQEKANRDSHIFYNTFTNGHILKEVHKHDEDIYLLLPLEVDVPDPYYNF